MKSSAIVVYCTASSFEEAKKITESLIAEKLAACVSMVPNLYSVYWWEGKIERAEEVLMMIKTQNSRFKALAQRIKQLHSYSVPEILVLPVVEGNPDYLKWLKKSTA
jgi:periplasmic divalent cation tolerance protein